MDDVDQSLLEFQRAAEALKSDNVVFLLASDETPEEAARVQALMAHVTINPVLGTRQFTVEVVSRHPQFAADAVALLKQVQQMGLNKEMTIFNAFITNVVAKGLPPEALENVYAMHYYYFDFMTLDLVPKVLSLAIWFICL